MNTEEVEGELKKIIGEELYAKYSSVKKKVEEILKWQPLSFYQN